MTIGIDIDDTMTNSTELMLEYAKNYFKEADNKKLIEIINSKIEGDLYNFYSKYLAEMMSKYKLKNNVVEVINRLREKGHKIVIITARGRTIKEGLIEVTKDYFNRNNIIVDEIVFRCADKSNVCIKYKIDLMIDDSISVLDKVNSCGIKTLLFTSIVNKNEKTNIKRIDDWIKLEKYIDNIDS